MMVIPDSHRITSSHPMTYCCLTNHSGVKVKEKSAVLIAVKMKIESCKCCRAKFGYHVIGR